MTFALYERAKNLEFSSGLKSANFCKRSALYGEQAVLRDVGARATRCNAALRPLQTGAA